MWVSIEGYLTYFKALSFLFLPISSTSQFVGFCFSTFSLVSIYSQTCQANLKIQCYLLWTLAILKNLFSFFLSFFFLNFGSSSPCHVSLHLTLYSLKYFPWSIRPVKVISDKEIHSLNKVEKQEQVHLPLRNCTLFCIFKVLGISTLSTTL